MDRRTYIYWATPLFILLSCGPLLEGTLGAVGALAVAAVVAVVAWGVVWLRLYTRARLRPEFAVLSILPHSIYFLERYFHSHLFVDSPAWQNVYALTWVAFACVCIAGVRCGRGEPPARLTLGVDSICLLMIPLILIYSVSSFCRYYIDITTL